ncbi:unnamed protein product [Aphanomyces euteiches]
MAFFRSSRRDSPDRVASVKQLLAGPFFFVNNLYFSDSVFVVATSMNFFTLHHSTIGSMRARPTCTDTESSSAGQAPSVLAMRRYYAKNRAKELLRFKAYYQKNKEKI